MKYVNRVIDLTDERQRKELLYTFNSFSTKKECYEYLGVCDNNQGIKYLKDICKVIGFDLDIYKLRRKSKTSKVCLTCGKEFITEYCSQKFCSRSCSATYNNQHRSEETIKKLKESLHRYNETRPKKEKIKLCPICGNKIDNNKKYCEDCRKKVKERNVETLHTYICGNCGKEFTSSNKNAKYCSNQCTADARHNEQYEDFLKNNEKYCRGNYTPKAFKNEFLKEQGGVCAICGCKPEHNGKPLVFILDHIDGDASNNKRENLRLVCPNCDSQLDTFKSKNKNSTRRDYWKEHIMKNITSYEIGNLH